MVIDPYPIVRVQSAMGLRGKDRYRKPTADNDKVIYLRTRARKAGHDLAHEGHLEIDSTIFGLGER